MNRDMTLAVEFVEYIPDCLKDRTIYVSKKFATVVHKCCCGCGKEVVTPISPTDWRLIVDGKLVSLYPSIGNWNFSCQSHYWITRNKVRWAPAWSKQKVNAGREYNKHLKDTFFNGSSISGSAKNDSIEVLDKVKSKQNFWQKLKKWLQ